MIFKAHFLSNHKAPKVDIYNIFLALGMLFNVPTVKHGPDLLAAVAKLPQDFCGVLAKHGSSPELRESHLLAAQAAAHQNRGFPVGIFHFLDKVIGNSLGSVQNGIVAV